MEDIKKFEDFLDRMQVILDNAKKQGHIIVRVEDLENAFPELKESEDEITWLTKYIEEEASSLSMDIRGNEDLIKLKNFQRSLAWLEKQGEKPNNVYDKELSEILGRIIRRYINDPNIPYIEREKVSKEIIPYVEWLEKQGDKDSFIEKELECIKGYRENAIKRLKELEKQGEQKPYGKRQECVDCQFNYACECKGSCAMKRGEQKPADKVEPKFEIGDWITNGEEIGQIIEWNHPDCIGYKNNHGTEKAFYKENFSKWHRWTIQEAKDGDVLHSPSHRLIWIYKDNEHYHACVNMNYVTDNVATDGLINIPNDACPATKDEQTILSAKLKEAGYEWDAERKELKKMENEIEIPFGSKDSELQEVTYFIPKGFHAEIDDDKVVIKKGEKLAWSEEDECCINQLIVFCENCMVQDCNAKKCANWLKHIKDRVLQQPKQEWSDEDDYNLQCWVAKAEADIRNGNVGRNEELINWLKSLKDRVGCEANCATTKEWSEEDENRFNNLIFLVECSKENGATKEGFIRFINKLKSLRPQNTWKPSDEQMKALDDALSLAKSCGEESAFDLSTLQDDLKRLLKI